MKHKHYDVIVSKAANMDLILFIKLGDKWQATGCHDNQVINIASHYEYFLCVPQHKDACLHWLNGGEAQTIFEGDWGARATPKAELGDWFSQVIWMQDTPIRIKPKKEKRWIIVDPTTDYTFNGLFMQKDEADEENGGVHQVIEIEVEV